MGAPDFPVSAGMWDQQREFYARKILAVFPERVTDPIIQFGDIELEYIRMHNEGLIPIWPDGQAQLNLKVGKGDNVVHAKDHGAIGDGVTDDTNALMTAVGIALTKKVPLQLTANATYALAGVFDIPAGTRLRTEGAKFIATAQTGRTAKIRIRSDTHIVGGIDVTTLGGVNGTGVSFPAAFNVYVDSIKVKSTIPGQGVGNVRDNGVNLTNSGNIRIDKMVVENFDWSVYAEIVSDLRIGHLEITTYSKALSIRDTPNFVLGGGWCKGVSPNASYLPGYNGVLIEANSPAENIHINNFTVYDAQEHGFRTSGPAQIKNIWFDNCAAINCIGSGFKVLGSILGNGVYNENVFFTSCLSEDSGLQNQNTNGFLIQMAKNVQMVSCIVRNRNKLVSGYAGVRLGGVSDVIISDISIINSSQFAIYIDSELANVSDVHISGKIRAAQGWGIYLANGSAAVSPVNSFKNLTFDMMIELGTATGRAFYANKATYPVEGTWDGFNRVAIKSPTTGVDMISNASSVAAFAGFICDLEGPKNLVAVFRDGSTWLDTVTGNKLLAKAGAWATL